jgi:hypothetical protein
MATKAFTKTSKYTLPAWQTVLLHVDGIYVDGKFFDENIPILGASINITAQPTSHARTRSLGISIATYRAGVVSQELLLYNQWWPFTAGVAEAVEDLMGIFYGVGLNMLSIVTQVDIPTNVPVIFTVNYELRVSY